METVTQNVVKSIQVTPSSAQPVPPSVSSTQVTTTPKKTKVVLGSFGNGRYSPAMDEVYGDVKRLLSFNNEQAHAVAAQVGRDAGQLDQQRVSLQFGKIGGKENKISLKQVASAVKVHCTPSLSIARICIELDATRKIGLVPPNDGFKVVPLLMDWVDSAAEKLEGVSKDEMERILATADK